MNRIELEWIAILDIYRILICYEGISIAYADITRVSFYIVSTKPIIHLFFS